jgi:hypothetical protein
MPYAPKWEQQERERERVTTTVTTYVTSVVVPSINKCRAIVRLGFCH